MCPPDSAEQRIHLEVLPGLGPQQEHILWDTVGHRKSHKHYSHCQWSGLSAQSPPRFQNLDLVGHSLTQLVKVSLGPARARHRAHQPGLEESAPFVYQHPLAASVILGKRGWSQLYAPPPWDLFPVLLLSTTERWMDDSTVSLPQFLYCKGTV